MDKEQKDIIKAAVEAIEQVLDSTVILSLIGGGARQLGAIKFLDPHLKALKGLIDD